MGGSTSKTRKLTVENDDPNNVIKVSEDVVDRLRGNQTVRQELQKNQTAFPPQGTPVITTPYFLNEPSLTTLQLRQQNVAELKKNDEYWENRIRALEASHKKMNEIMDKEYNKAVEQFQGSKTVVKEKSLPPCTESEKAVMECYQCYPNESMRCSKIVQAFQECVDMRRSCLLANRG
ncbi:coiled-coil-helix-coiled-coil-helix domain containing 3 [Leptinotarsa decemlineata]|uniref:coiled-coil-helix-coiled-coil-helix domain containing 3 n=1 Tax=Leptinotarsa decemlineata TaxID=7539 RepID=UPI000C251826|nr:MICOS complex subunit MIC19-like isoform X1 [Leptinotarsa decemlineata]